MTESWLRMPYARRPLSDSTLKRMKKDELIEIIRDYEHNYEALYEANERGIAAAEKMLQDRKTGHWIVTGRKIRCSACDRAVYIGTDDSDVMETEARLRHYCSCCGALMLA